MDALSIETTVRAYLARPHSSDGDEWLDELAREQFAFPREVVIAHINKIIAEMMTRDAKTLKEIARDLNIPSTVVDALIVYIARSCFSNIKAFVTAQGGLDEVRAKFGEEHAKKYSVKEQKCRASILLDIDDFFVAQQKNEVSSDKLSNNTRIMDTSATKAAVLTYLTLPHSDDAKVWLREFADSTESFGCSRVDATIYIEQHLFELMHKQEKPIEEAARICNMPTIIAHTLMTHLTYRYKQRLIEMTNRRGGIDGIREQLGEDMANTCEEIFAKTASLSEMFENLARV